MDRIWNVYPGSTDLPGDYMFRIIYPYLISVCFSLYTSWYSRLNKDVEIWIGFWNVYPGSTDLVDYMFRTSTLLSLSVSVVYQLVFQTYKDRYEIRIGFWTCQSRESETCVDYMSRIISISLSVLVSVCNTSWYTD